MQNKESGQWMRWMIVIFVDIIIVIVSVILAFASLDNRLVVVETKQEQKVDGERMQIMLKDWKDEIINEIKGELKNMGNPK
jgi:hypothetical protein